MLAELVGQLPQFALGGKDDSVDALFEFYEWRPQSVEVVGDDDIDQRSTASTSKVRQRLLRRPGLPFVFQRVTN